MSDSSASNPFDTLGLPPSYRVDRDQIERAYRTRLASTHPDAGGDEGGADSAALNDARAILLDDEQRAVALLDLFGGPDASLCKDLPEGFLMQMMMQREAIEEAIESGGEEERRQWEQWGLEQRSSKRDWIEALFEALDAQSDDESLRTIRVELNAWRYIERLIEQLDSDYDPSVADFGR